MAKYSLLAHLAAHYGFSPAAVFGFGAAEFAAAHNPDGERVFLGAALGRKFFPAGFDGEDFGSADGFLRVVSASAALAELFRSIFPWCAPHVGFSAAELPPGGADALVFDRVEQGNQNGYSLACPVTCAMTQLPAGFSDYVHTVGRSASGALATVDCDAYAGRTFVLPDGSGISFDVECSRRCRAQFGNLLPKLVFWNRTLRKMRGDDFRLVLETDADDAELLYLAREIRALKLPHVAFRVPDARKERARLILTYGDFLLA